MHSIATEWSGPVSPEKQRIIASQRHCNARRLSNQPEISLPPPSSPHKDFLHKNLLNYSDHKCKKFWALSVPGQTQ